MHMVGAVIFLFWFGAGSLYSNVSAGTLDHYSQRRHYIIGIGISIINLRRPSDRLKFVMGISISIGRCFRGTEALVIIRFFQY